MPTWLPIVLELLGIVYNELSPTLKADLEAELAKAAVAKAGKPLIEMLIEIAEAAVAALPASLPTAPAA